jgi:hypothetical protein
MKKKHNGLVDTKLISSKAVISLGQMGRYGAKLTEFW